MSQRLVGVDVGGTFTDLILHDAGSDQPLRVAKVPTTLDNQAGGVLAAIEAAGAELAAIDLIVHGTTTTTNALLERKIAKVGLITTEGFRDVLELGRRTRPQPYGMTGTFEPIVPRERRLEVPERMDAAGEVVVPLNEAAVAEAARRLLALGAEALVIHFLHAYRNPAHELRAGEIARALWPGGHVTLGHQVLSEYREYERGTTAAVNAAVQPVLHRYLERLTGELRRRGYARDLLVMQGNGGTVSAGRAATEAVKTVMSGPASGVMAAAHAARAAGLGNLVTYDMGGTSTDVALVLNGVPQVSGELELEYAMPIHVPMVDVHTIGAGGGSIARVDDAGLLRVGPQSAGALPGPICYGRGGTEPTITDANLLLGRLDPKRLLSVDAPVSLEDLRGVFAEKLGGPLGLDAVEAAAAVLRIAEDRMAGAIRMVSLSRGHDPRDFSLFAFGGAGPLHAAALARELAIPKVVIPARPGLTNALGCLVADLRHDFVQTINKPLHTVDMKKVHALLTQQAEEGRRLLDEERVEMEGLEVLHFADMQFQGQTHLLTVALEDARPSREALHEAFSAAYWQRFMVELAEIRPMLVNLHSVVIGRRPALALETLAGDEAKGSLEEALQTHRPVWFPGGWRETPVYRRSALPSGCRLEGPAILQQMDTTTVIPPGARAEVDAFGNLILEVGG